MKLVTVDHAGIALPGAVVEDNVLLFALVGDVLPLSRWVPRSMIDILAAGDDGIALLRRILDAVREIGEDGENRLRAANALLPLNGVRLLAPVPEPRLIFSTGLAYRDHASEMRGPSLSTPAGSMRCASSIIGPEAPIILPAAFPDMVDIEVELSVVIGRDAYCVSREDAMAHVAGYTLYNDVSARDWNASRDLDLVRQGKQMPGFGPLGPWIVTCDDVPDAYDIEVRSSINGVALQCDNTANLLFDIPEMISHLSQWFRFQPGDIITTGSPGGVGWAQDPQIFLRPGDVVRIEASGIGWLRNPVISGGTSKDILS